jgi:hypothetical protein
MQHEKIQKKKKKKKISLREDKEHKAKKPLSLTIPPKAKEEENGGLK